MDKKLVTVADAALLMSVSKAFLYPKIMSGEIRSIKIGRARRIPVSVIDEWIAKQVEEAAEQEGASHESGGFLDA